MIDKKYLSIGTDDRIHESLFNYHKLYEHYQKNKKPEKFVDFIKWLNEFRYLFNNFLICVMTIKDTLDKDYNKIEGYNKWWNEKIGEIKKEFSINFVALRNAHQHENNGFITYVVSVEKTPTIMTLHFDYSYPRERIITSMQMDYDTSGEDLDNYRASIAESHLQKNKITPPKQPRDDDFEKELIMDEDLGREITMKFYLMKKGYQQSLKIQEILVNEGETSLTGLIIKSRDELIKPATMMEICKSLITKFKAIGDEASELFQSK